MVGFRRAFAAAVALALMAPVAASRAAPAADQHGTHSGHLPGTSENVELVGRVSLTDVEWGIGDVGALGTTAYVAAYSGECFNQSSQSQGGGVHIVDFSIPQLPLEIGFISAGANTYVGEGVQAMHMKTRSFTGDIVLMANEPCARGRKANGGISLWDVTDPRAPEPLAIGVGDRKPKPAKGLSAHSSHSAMMWQAGKKAYAVLVDNEDWADVDIMDITNPRKPRLIAETGLAKWRGVNKRQEVPLGNFPASFHHDMWVKKIKGHWRMLVSYWDTGWVLLNIDDPRKPRFIKDSDFPKRDEHTRRKPEGNGHQAIWSTDDTFVLGTTEDLFAKFTVTLMGKPGRTRFASTMEYPWARSVNAVGFLAGVTVYGGTGCAPFALPPASSAGSLEQGKVPVVVLQESTCSYSEQLTAAARAGYPAAVVAASHQTAGFGTAPTRFDCAQDPKGPVPSIVVVCMSHADFHALFRSEPGYDVVALEGEPAVGSKGLPLQVSTFEDDTWGDLHLLNAKTFKEIDSYQIPEQVNPRYAEAFGPLSVHEIKPDPRKRVHLGYASWYSGGLRVMAFGSKGLREVGRYIDDGGNTFWGTFPVAQDGDRPLLLMSDVHDGLWIFRYTGPE